MKRGGLILIGVSAAALLLAVNTRGRAYSGFDFSGLANYAPAVSGVGVDLAASGGVSPSSPRDIVAARLSSAQSLIARPFVITSWLRTAAENTSAGGAAKSLHLKGAAVDISTDGQDRFSLYSALKSAGFSGFGFYETHIHADIGDARRWFQNDKARAIWSGVA